MYCKVSTLNYFLFRETIVIVRCFAANKCEWVRCEYVIFLYIHGTLVQPIWASAKRSETIGIQIAYETVEFVFAVQYIKI